MLPPHLSRYPENTLRTQSQGLAAQLFEVALREGYEPEQEFNGTGYYFVTLRCEELTFARLLSEAGRLRAKELTEANSLGSSA